MMGKASQADTNDTSMKIAAGWNSFLVQEYDPCNNITDSRPVEPSKTF